MNRFTENWVYGGTAAAGMLCLIALGLFNLIGATLSAVFLLMPAYMVHQFEEHVDDRFRRFVDQELGRGHPVLTRQDIFLINVPGVWGLFAGAFALSAALALGYGLIPAYSALINVFMHVAPAIKMRRYNPGLVSALLLLLPSSMWAIALLSQDEGVTWQYHVLGVGLGIAIHAGIMVLAAKRLRGSIPSAA
jgi:hypothetical protein